jgi:uncharacterized caspase-like protein
LTAASIFFLGIAALNPAFADGSGVALVIGNSAYKNAKALPTAIADADATAQTLQAAGYDVTEYHDVAQADIGPVMRDFLTKVQNAGSNTVAFLYFSGYAMQFNGDDYLVPSDANITKDTDIPGEALRLTDVTDELANLQTQAEIVVVDGSRANGFDQSGGAPSAPGLAIMNASPGMLIAYSTQPGTVAPDGNGPYSLFAGSLNTTMRQPGYTFGEIFKITRLNVSQATNGVQVPWTASALSGDVRLFEPPEQNQAPGVAEVAPQEPAVPAAEDLRVALGDNIERVRAAYNIKVDPLPTQNEQLLLNAPLDGLMFFFNEKDQTLRNIRADAPFAGSINGVRIGDNLDDVIARLGQPSRAPFDFNPNKAYLFRFGPNWFRCDFNKEQKVATMFQFVADR